VHLLEEASKSGWFHAYLKLGSMYESTSQVKSQEYYHVNDLVFLIHSKDRDDTVDDILHDTDRVANELYSIFTKSLSILKKTENFK
jgi:hypothetical protein